MKLSDAEVLSLKQSEGCRLDAYRCEAGKLTIGYGDTRGVKAGDRITLEEAERRLMVRIDEFERAVLGCVKRPMTQGQFDALVSLAYNIGSAALASSELIRLFNAGDLEAAARQFARWVHVKGDPVHVRKGDRGDQVIEWQRKLKAEGIDVKVDGDFGAATEAATKLYQSRLGPEGIDSPPGVGVVHKKEISANLVSRRFREVVRFLR